MIHHVLIVTALERIHQQAQFQGQEEAEGDNEDSGKSSSDHEVASACVCVRVCNHICRLIEICVLIIHTYMVNRYVKIQ